MGERVDAASNEVRDFGGEEGIFCPTCGEESEHHPSGYVGWAPVAAAEARWLDVNGTLACSVYCASKEMGLSEKEAQLNRAAKTRANMRVAGLNALADHDQKVVQARLKQREEDIENFGGSVIADIEKLTSESGEPHGLNLADESQTTPPEGMREVWEEIKDAALDRQRGYPTAEEREREERGDN